MLCLGAAAIAAGSLFPPELPAQGATTELTTLPAGDSLATCPASVRLLKGAGNGTDPEFAPASKDAKSLVRAAALSDSAGRIPGAQLLEANGSAGQQLAPRLDEAEAATLTGAAKDGTSQRKGVVRGGVSHDAPLSLRTQPLGGVQSLAAAARYYTAKDGDLAGLAAAPCTAPGSESWITGAATTGGTTSILHLVNSSTSVSQVRIDLRGAGGMIPAPNLESVAIAPGESKSLVLAAYAPNEKSLSLKVVASGGRVNASIQQSTLRGLVPGGVDYLVAGTPAANSQVIPGVVLLDPKLAGELAGSAATADAVPELHVAATSAEGATVKIRVLGAAGEVAVPGGGELVVASNATARLPLTGLPAGAYTVVVEGDSAVSAAVKLVRGTKAAEPMDQAWAPGAARIGSEHLVVLPEFGNAKLVLNAPAESSTVTLRPLGKERGTGRGEEDRALGLQDRGACRPATWGPTWQPWCSRPAAPRATRQRSSRRAQPALPCSAGRSPGGTRGRPGAAAPLTGLRQRVRGPSPRTRCPIRGSRGRCPAGPWPTARPVARRPPCARTRPTRRGPGRPARWGAGTR